MGSRATLALVAISALTSGCVVTSSEDPAPAPPPVVVEPAPTVPTKSELVLHWTIAGLTDPNECVKGVVDRIQIVLIDDTTEVEVGTFEQTCTAFATSIALDPGSYSGFAVLLDGAGQPRTTDVAITGFTLQSNEQLNVSVEFPSDSFF